jgi:predicted porin
MRSIGKSENVPGQRCTRTLISSAVLLGFCAYAAPTYADELSDLKAQIQVLSQRLTDLEKKENQQKNSQQSQAVDAVPTGKSPVAVAAPAMQTDQNGLPMGEAPAVTLYDGYDTSLKVYGLIEATISRANHQTESDGFATGSQSAWFAGNRLGFDGTHALAVGNEIGMPDLKVIAKLESQFELPTGSSPNSTTIFYRDAWLGMYSDEMGKFTVGRQNTLTRDFTQTWGDPYGTDQVVYREGGYTNVNNFVQFIGYSSSPTGSRLDSALVWKKKWGDHWLTGLAYGFGSGGAGGAGSSDLGGATPGDYTKGTSQEVSIAYNGLKLGPTKLNANFSYDRANVSDLIHQSELLGGNIEYGYFRLNGGYVHYTAQQGFDDRAGTRTDNSWTTSMSFIPGGRMEYDIGFQEMNGDHAGYSTTGSHLTLSPFADTSLVTAFANGGKNTLYGSVIFHADKQFLVYLVSDYMRVKGGWRISDALGNGDAFGASGADDSEVEVGIGAQYKF